MGRNRLLTMTAIDDHSPAEIIRHVEAYIASAPLPDVDGAIRYAESAIERRLTRGEETRVIEFCDETVGWEGAP